MAEFFEQHGTRGEVGTVLSLQPEPARTQLWRGEFHYVSVSPSRVEMSEAARRIEIFLDAVAAEAATQAPYLLDPRYAALLSPDEARLAQTLSELANQLEAQAEQWGGHARGWGELLATLRRLGAE